MSCCHLQTVYGDNVDVARFQAQPRTPAQQIMDRIKELEARRAELEAELAAADNEYLKAVAAKKQKGGWAGWRRAGRPLLKRGVEVPKRDPVGAHMQNASLAAPCCHVPPSSSARRTLPNLRAVYVLYQLM